MTDRPRRARRVQLSTPGSSEKMIQKASESKADHVFLDLEDAVAPSQKRDARKKIIEGLKTLNWTGKTRCVRINDLTTEYAYEDIIEIVEGAGEHLDTIMMTKVQTAADVLFADKLLHQIEKKLKMKRKIGLEALIEEVEGMQNVDSIAACTPRLECLVFGMGDFSASMGVTNRNVGETDGYPGDIWHYARFRLIMACRAAGIDPVDGPFADFKNPDAYREECKRSMILGCVGKWAIHPSQIDIALDVYSPKPEDIARARKLEKAYAEAEAAGLGAINVDGIMVDVASIRILRNTILNKADLYGL
ncbi:CoA ester lyase [Reyranella sp.]|jgi:citrate lyase subunit beta/citryl-CoA lyase|uniref:HpcH/HpaI aldolase/citrate lyase family protein n=1 Tax=Reyranella sp. TaxID=1929291 RepID=UPI000BD5FCF1|nr:CoA ester lyase [Reyranella sp.]OYY44186.1 MAG: CoA ester lyase [Rhodospirillales bacterium 35-66-84]OYZ94862.1 MAG: CoA ester lyase [Rhodospirillales bacterium 24-66-33]OZB26063.1 MAG: CoA ester lyase [Rhodospirillales bacterium 39-66-50]HQS15243.1 CoA ester lyase [Reyranella sp.]HQT11052.1 CoA ester lyase [Reyranella sp.]